MVSIALGTVAISLGFIAIDLKAFAEVGLLLFIIGTSLFGFFVGLLYPDVLRKMNLARLQRHQEEIETLVKKS
jgi:hypothetical protein